MGTKRFKRGNGTSVSYDEMVRLIADYIAKDSQKDYEITVGTDSQNHSDTKIVETIVLHRVGDGGIFFYYVEHIRRIRSLKEKIVEETSRSLSNAEGLLDDIELLLMEQGIDIDKLNIHFQIHCDIGHRGRTQALIKDITSWVTSMGYDCAIKPESYAASGVANKISK